MVTTKLERLAVKIHNKPIQTISILLAIIIGLGVLVGIAAGVVNFISTWSENVEALKDTISVVVMIVVMGFLVFTIHKTSGS